MNKLYDQLLYNWERGFYSVVKGGDGEYAVFTIPRKPGGFEFSGWFESVERAKNFLFRCEVCNIGEWNESKFWKIVDTIHISRLMGKGFQVGDKVKIVKKDDTLEGKLAEIVYIDNYLSEHPILVETKDDGKRRYQSEDLKPVLPVEEKKVCVICKQQETREGSNLFCKDCIQQVLKEMPTKDDKNACEMCGHGTEIGFTTKDFETYIKVNGYIRMLEQGDKEQQAEARKIKKKKGKDGHIVNL